MSQDRFSSHARQAITPTVHADLQIADAQAFVTSWQNLLQGIDAKRSRGRA